MLAESAERTQWMTLDAVAEYAHVTRQAVQHWVRGGRLRSYRAPGTRRRLVDLRDLEKFLRGETAAAAS